MYNYSMKKQKRDDFRKLRKIKIFLENHLKKFNEGKNKSNWSGKRIQDIFKEIKMTNFYEMGYRKLSKFSHPSYVKQIDLEKETSYPEFLRNFIINDIFVMTLAGIKLLNEKYDLLVGDVYLSDYPQKESDFFFSINNKKYD
jgi:hypothetical protein